RKINDWPNNILQVTLSAKLKLKELGFSLSQIPNSIFPINSSLSNSIRSKTMAPALPQFYSGTSTLALVARLSAFSAGLFYGNAKLKVLKMKSKSEKKAEANAHH
ncbi:hypothetical protein KSS87_003676, partial [Heliosperma pusillum]